MREATAPERVDRPRAAPSPPWAVYAVPMGVFLALTSLEGAIPRVDGHLHPVFYPLAYAAKFLLTAIAAWLCRPAWRDFLPNASVRGVVLGLVTGIGVAALWIGLDGRYPALPLTGARAAFDPDLVPGRGREAFLAVRFLGLVALVPLIEELFWRSFLMRVVIRPDFRSLPVGAVTWTAALVTSVLFALAHPEWLPALLTGLLWAGLLRATRSLLACLASHVAANLALGVYVLVTGAWRFW